MSSRCQAARMAQQPVAPPHRLRRLQGHSAYEQTVSLSLHV